LTAGNEPHLICACNAPKTLPDFESAGACWVQVGELSCLPLRDAHAPCLWFNLLADGPGDLQETVPLINTLQLPAEWQEVFKDFPVDEQQQQQHLSVARCSRFSSPQ
jgi:hypothetical protein